ncbi:MAG: RluA family pseudouridine synthase [Clostridiales bacterium]|nr:RluA family pseudouridine synthase [Clostridiales bacterium]
MKVVMKLNAEGAKRQADKVYIVGEPAKLLDFLLEKLTNKSRNNVKSLLTNKTVSVDGKTVTRHDHPLWKGQTVTIASKAHMLKKQYNQLNILYEDDELLAIDKPAGLLSIATDDEKEKTAYRLMTEYVRIGNPNGRVFIVHRLDRDTSGVLISAKNERLKLALQSNWNNLVTTRGYTAIVEDMPKERSGQITSWLKETKTHRTYSSSTAGDGREAVTNYRVIKASNNYALLKISIETGRKNQIRVHMKDLCHPIAGDKKYGAKTNPLGRLCLHAELLEFRHPFTDRHMILKSAVPKSFMGLPWTSE